MTQRANIPDIENLDGELLCEFLDAYLGFGFDKACGPREEREEQRSR